MALHLSSEWRCTRTRMRRSGPNGLNSNLIHAMVLPDAVVAPVVGQYKLAIVCLSKNFGGFVSELMHMPHAVLS